MRRIVVADDRDALVGGVEGTQVAADLQELGAVLDLLNVAVELVFAQVVGGKQVPDPVGAGVGRAAARARCAVGVPVLAAAFGPLAAGMGHQVERAELVQAEHDLGFAGLGRTSPSAMA